MTNMKRQDPEYVVWMNETVFYYPDAVANHL